MDRGPLRIVHTVSSLQGGGMENFVLRLAESQRKRGHEATIVAMRSGPLLELARRSTGEAQALAGDAPAPGFAAFQATALQKGLPTTVLRGGSRYTRVLHAALHFVLARPQIVHCHNPTSLQYAAIAKRVSGARLVFTDHAQTKGILRAGTRREWGLVDAYASVSAETALHCGDIGYRGTPEVVHNGIDFTPPRRPRAEVRAEMGLGDRIVGANVASFHPVKAQDVLIRAAAELEGRGVPVTVLSVGDGTERASVEKLAADLGLGPEHVRFLGFRIDIADLLGASDFFVLPSRSEGLPISVLEAMSHRLPVVCTPVGGNPELVTDGEHGFLVPVDDPVALAGAMARLASDADLRKRLGDAGYARVRDEFSFDRTADRYEAIYRRVVAAER